MSKCLKCEKKARSRFLCSRHYKQALASGNLPPLAQPWQKQSAEERFHAKVREDAHSGCWIWTGALSDTGYGSFRDRATVSAHRWAYEFYRCEIPDGLVIDHLCRNRACVNPWHLEPVTYAVNTTRGTLAELQRSRAAAITHCPHGHPREGNTYIRPDTGHTVCKACANARQRARYAQKATTR